VNYYIANFSLTMQPHTWQTEYALHTQFVHKTKQNATNLKPLNNLPQWQRSLRPTNICCWWQLENSVHVRLV